MEFFVIAPMYLVATFLLIWLGVRIGRRVPYTGLKRRLLRILLPVALIFPLYQELLILPVIYKYICWDVDLSEMVQTTQPVPMLFVYKDDGSCGELCRNGLFKYNLPAVVGVDTRWNNGQITSETWWKFEAIPCDNPTETQCVTKTDVTNIPREEKYWVTNRVVEELSNPDDYFQIMLKFDQNPHTGHVVRAQQQVEFIYPALSNFIILLHYKEPYRNCESPLYSTYPEADYWSEL